MALNPPKAKTDEINVNPLADGNFASAACKKLGGISLSLLNKKKEALGFCLFKDKTMVDSWTLANEIRETK